LSWRCQRSALSATARRSAASVADAARGLFKLSKSTEMLVELSTSTTATSSRAILPFSRRKHTRATSFSTLTSQPPGMGAAARLSTLPLPS
jgi:hypothetical protein